jgi:hypothetical protein
MGVPMRGFRLICASMAIAAILAMGGRAKAQLLPGIDSIAPEISISTLGIGADADVHLESLPLGFRVGANFLTLTHSISTSDINYNGKATLENGGLIGDWYPFGSGFRLSGGIKVNGNNATVTANPATSSTIIVNNVPYATTGSSINGKVTFDEAAPYAGLGFGGRIFGGPTLGIDLGAMFQGTPRSALTASGPITGLPGFAGNFAVEQVEFQNKIKNFTIYPVAAISLGWRF